MESSVKEIIESYNPNSPLAEASTIPAPWYVDARIVDLERRAVFARSWQMAGRADQVREPGQYITCELAGEPLLIVRGSDHTLRGFFNVCRHHAAAVMTEAEGSAPALRCPYHGWTYTLARQSGDPLRAADSAGRGTGVRRGHGRSSDLRRIRRYYF
ncbi:MAG: Rieske (2Fe-2S) protein [Acidobacteria bacterium]|nr:Rieske (2Fe-2S) protein [Acidobacteriota bacterium]